MAITRAAAAAGAEAESEAAADGVITDSEAGDGGEDAGAAAEATAVGWGGLTIEEAMAAAVGASALVARSLSLRRRQGNRIGKSLVSRSRVDSAVHWNRPHSVLKLLSTVPKLKGAKHPRRSVTVAIRCRQPEHRCKP